MLGALALVAALPPGASAQQPSAGLAVVPGVRTLTAVEAAVPPVLDGAVLDDPAWAAAEPATGFLQTQPDEGRPATERTEVRVVFTADTLYVGVVCYDADPASIIVTDSRRDSSLADSDSFQLILDTFLDRQNGFVFGTSPSGQEYDGQLVNEGAGGSGMGGGGQTRGAGGGFNLNWDGVWQVRTAIDEVGWSAEFAIPFRTLRFPAGREQTGASTSSATSAGGTSPRTGRRCHASSTCSASRSRGSSAAWPRPRGSGGRCR